MPTVESESQIPEILALNPGQTHFLGHKKSACPGKRGRMVSLLKVNFKVTMIHQHYRNIQKPKIDCCYIVINVLKQRETVLMKYLKYQLAHCPYWTLLSICTMVAGQHKSSKHRYKV